jgi:hypothetical protein
MGVDRPPDTEAPGDRGVREAPVAQSESFLVDLAGGPAA